MSGSTLPTMIQRVVDATGHVAILTDFDGVVSPIVDDPAEARPLEGMVEALAVLCDDATTVGLVSGRPVSFLSQFFDGRFLKVGLYGLEVAHRGERRDLAEVDQWRHVIADVVGRCGPLADQGVLVESKGLSLTLHFRQCPDRADEVAAMASAEADRTGLEARPAKMSIELHPPIHVDKGTSITALFGDAGGVLYFGDDVGDLAALDGLSRLHEAGAVVASVAVDGPETPPSLVERADVVVDGSEGALALLQAIGRLRR